MSKKVLTAAFVMLALSLLIQGAGLALQISDRNAQTDAGTVAAAVSTPTSADNVLMDVSSNTYETLYGKTTHFRYFEAGDTYRTYVTLDSGDKIVIKDYLIPRGSLVEVVVDTGNTNAREDDIVVQVNAKTQIESEWVAQ